MTIPSPAEKIITSMGEGLRFKINLNISAKVIISAKIMIEGISAHGVAVTEVIPKRLDKSIVIAVPAIKWGISQP